MKEDNKLRIPFLALQLVTIQAGDVFRRTAPQIKKLIELKLTGAPKILGVDPFPNPVIHFWALWRQF